MQLLPHFKGRHFIPEGTSVDFMSLRRVCFWASMAIMITAASLFATMGLNYGVDFKGGTMIELRTKAADGGTAPPADITALRDQVGGLGLGDVQIQEFGQPSDVLIRVEQQGGGETAQQDALNKVLEAVGDDYVQRRVEVVGPAVSSELRTTGIIAVLASIFAIILYIWFRFEWQFAIGAVMALTHDVLVTVGVFALFQMEFDLSTVAALLTILGYSVNDTVVVSDRIRENLRKFKRMALPDLLNRSINETLSRTLMTSGTTLIVLFALYFLGGEVIRNFTFAMLFGVIIGTYSSIFIAAPILELLGVKRDWSGVTKDQQAAASAAAS